MNLLIDIGNTRIKWALSQDGQFVDFGVCAPEQQWPPCLPVNKAQTIYACCVGQAQLLKDIQDLAKQAGKPVVVAQVRAYQAGLKHGYTRANEHGVDRWMACLGARQLTSESVLIADAGTALTLDYIDRNNQHHGGIIAPGLSTMAQSLGEHTQLGNAHLGAQGQWRAYATEMAIANGILLSAVAVLDRAVAEFKPERLLITGGEAQLLAGHLVQHWNYEPHLVLKGLLEYSKQESLCAEIKEKTLDSR